MASNPRATEGRKRSADEDFLVRLEMEGEAASIDHGAFQYGELKNGDTNVYQLGPVVTYASPTGTDRSLTTPSRYTLRLPDFGFSDPDGNAFASVRITTLATSGTLFYDANGSNGGQRTAVTVGQSISVLDILADKLTFVSSGTSQAAFTFQVRDSNNELDASANTLTFNPLASNTVNTLFGTSINLNGLTIGNGFKLSGPALSGTGGSLGYAGDINGDGFADFIVGASQDDAAFYNAGAAFVVFGKATGFGAVDLTTLNGTTGFKLTGEADSDAAGGSVSSAGDINGDGFDDLIIGAIQNDAGGSQAGAAYVVFGRASGFTATLSLANLTTGSNGFKITGEAGSDFAGSSVSSAGDINGDGFADIIVGARFQGGGNNGAAYVVFGKATGFGNISLAAIAAGTGGFKITGEAGANYMGRAVSSADVNGDGFSDLIVSAYANSNAGRSANGAVYVIFGSATLTSAPNLATLNGSNGFRIQGALNADYAGWSASSAGDVNGDGFADILIGQRDYANGGATNHAGAAYVVFGKANGTYTVPVDLNGISAANGFRIAGENANDYTGITVSNAGDVNGDGFADILVGSINHNGAAGASYLIFGKASGFGPVNLATLGTAGVKINGEGANSRAGAVSAAGDVNGDGFADLLVGATGNTAAYVIFGRSNVANTAPVANPDTLAAIEDTQIIYTAAQLLGNDTDAQSNALTIASVASGTGGSVLLNGNGTVTFTPMTNFNGAASFTYIASDGSLTSNSATVTVNVTAVNDAPTSTGLQGDSVTTTEPAGGLGSVLPAVKIDAGGNATLADVDNLNFGGGSIRFLIGSGFVNGQDYLNIDTQAATTVTVAAGTVSVGGTAIGTVTGGGPGSGDMIVALNANATPTLVQTLIRAIDFVNAGNDNPTAGARTITTTLVDGGGTANGGVDTLVMTSTVTVTPANDVPTFPGLPASVGAFTGGVAGNVDLSPLTIFDPDSPGPGAQLALSATSAGTFALATVAGVTVGGNATNPTLTGTIVALDAYLNTPSNIQFTPATTLNGSFAVQFTLNDSTGTSAIQTVAATVNFAATSLTAAGTVYSQNFDTLAQGTSGMTPTGWTFSESGAGSNTTYSAGTGSSNTGDTYSFGANASGDRALGTQLSGNVTPTIGGAFTNNTGTVITSLLVSYTGEQWRLGSTGRADQLDFQYSTNATGLATGTWTDVNALDFVAPQTTVLGALDGNAAANRTTISNVEITGLNIAPGATIWIRWTDLNAAGADDGLAIDDFSITAKSIMAGNDTGNVNENATILNANLFGNDSAAGGTLSVGAVNGVAGNVGTQIALASGALLTVRANGTYDYNPNGQFNTLIDAATATATGATNTSATDTFTYTLSGGQTATVTVTVNGVASATDQLGGSAGNETVTGTPGADYFNLSQGGDDTATGGAGNDAFFFGAAFTALDNVDGGPGTNDQVGLQGNYSGGLTLGAGSLVNIETLAVLPGFSYNITSIDANVAAGQMLSVYGGGLGALDNFTFNGSAETDGSFAMFGGLGNDTFTGGALNDGFYFGPGKWGAGDTVVGGGGTNDQLALDGDYTISVGANADVEVLALLPGPGGSPNTFNITLLDAWTAAATTKTVWGAQVTTAMTINGAAETNGNLILFGGAVSDTLTGGTGADTISGGGGGDAMTGGSGADIFRYDNTSDSTGSTNATRDRILDFAAGDKIDLSRIDAITGGGDDAFTFIGSAAFSNTAGQLRYTDLGGGIFNVEGDVNGDNIADFAILVTAGPGYAWTGGDFIP